MRHRFFRVFLLPYFPVALAPFLLFFLPLVQGKTLFWGLPALQFIPWRAYADQIISQGILPLWNPLNGMGAPLLANYQLALFYPPGWLADLVGIFGGTPGIAWAQTLLIPIHLAWAGIGMTFLLRRLDVSELGQTIGGLAFGMSGYLVARSGFYSMIWAGAWMPWVLWAVSSITKPVRDISFDTKLFNPILVLCITMQLLAGHAQLTWYSLSFAAIWVITGGFLSGGWRKALRGFFVLALNGLLAVAISAIQLFPTAEYLLQSQRSSAVDFDLGLTYSFWPWRFLTFIAPNLFGNPGSGNYWGYASFWEDATYIGILPLMLALPTALLMGKKGDGQTRQPLIRLLWAIILIGCVFALGNNTPIFPFLYHYVPTFSLFNGPARWMIWVVFSLSILAGFGAQAWRRPVGKSLRRLRRLTVATAAITIGAGAAWLVMRSVQITFIEATAMLGIWATGGCLLTLTQPRQMDGKEFRWWQRIAISWIVIDLVWAGFSLIPAVSSTLFSKNLNSPQIPVTDQRFYLSEADEYSLKFHRFFRFSDYSSIEDWGHLRQVALPNLNLLPGSQFSYINNFDPFVPGRYNQWMKWVNGLSKEKQDVVLHMMNAGYRLQKDTSNSIGITVVPLSDSKRMRWFGCGIWVDNEQKSWEWVKSQVDQDAMTLYNTVVLEGKSQLDRSCDLNSKAEIKVESDSPEQVTVHISSNTSGFLFVADTWYPGWKASVDGVYADLLPADYLFQAVSVPAGSHKVQIYYSPSSFKLGMVITVIGLLGMVIWTFYLKHRVQ